MSTNARTSVNADAPATNRGWGRALTLTGAVIVAVAAGIVVMMLASLGASDGSSGSLDIGEWLGRPLILLLVSICFLIPGELLRRGMIGARAEGSGRRSASPLPTGSRVAAFRPLSLGFHSLWLVVALGIWAALVLVPSAGIAAGTWPASLRGDDRAQTELILALYGAVVAGLAGAVATSLVKKCAYRRWLTNRSGFGATRPPRAGNFWRWFTFRWRLDIWLGGLGGLAWGIVPFIAVSSTPGDAVGFVIVGGLLVAAGIGTTLQYWRAGEALGSGESMS